jgi:RNA polymerase sigma factor (sigma-70 family)
LVEDLNDQEHLRWEEKLIRRAQAGDREAFAELYRAYAGKIYSRILLPQLGQRSAAEDALAETFRSALERLASFEPRGSSVYFWIARIAANKATDMHRASGVTGRVLVNVRALLLPTLEGPLQPEQALSEREQQASAEGRVAECLAALNPRYRAAIELRFFEGHTRESCAEALAVKLGTFDVLLLRALRAFRTQWDTVSRDSTP